MEGLNIVGIVLEDKVDIICWEGNVKDVPTNARVLYEHMACELHVSRSMWWTKIIWHWNDP